MLTMAASAVLENNTKTMPYLMKVTSVVLFVSTLFVLSASLDQFACYQDICNRDPSNPQYCNTKEGQKRCQHCDDVASSCGGPKMPYNCSNFCINREVEKQMQAEKEKECNGDSLPQTKNGDLNGDHTILDTYLQGSIINYTCHDGYSSIGPAATCGPYGQWSPPPICQAKFCTLPGLKGLRIEPVEDHYPVLMRVRVTCTSDDTISVELQCTSSGMWDQAVPNCHTDKEVEKRMQAEKVKACNGDSIPQTKNGDLNGDHSILETYSQGSMINYTCHDGYSPIGPAATCGPYGQWSPPPICQAKICTLPRLNGLRIEPVEDHYPVLTRVRVTCTSDDTITVELQCTSNGTWDQPVPNCHIGDTNGGISWIILGVVIFIVILVFSVFGLYKIKQSCNREKHNSSCQDIEKGNSPEKQPLIKTEKNKEEDNDNNENAKLTHQNKVNEKIHLSDTGVKIQNEEKQKFSAVPPRDPDTAGDTVIKNDVNEDSRIPRNKEQISAKMKQEPNTETTSASSIDHQTRSVPRNLSNDREDQKKTPDICFSDSSDHNASGDDGHSSNGNITKQSVTNKSGNNEATFNVNLHIHNSNSNSYHHTINLTQARCKTSDTHNTTGASHHAGDETSDTHNTTGVPHHAGDDTSDTHNTTGVPHHAGDDTSDTHNTTGAPHHVEDDTSDTHNTTGAPHHAGDDTSHTKNRTGESHLPMEEGKHPVPETGNYPTEESEKVLSPRNKILQPALEKTHSS